MTYPKIKLTADAKRDAQLGVDFLQYTHGKNKKKFLRMFFPNELLAVINGKVSARMIPQWAREQNIKKFLDRYLL
ncbi:MAG: hypothetical protein V1656_00505 [Candidatus Jorgensenbacteria bacterium]